MVAHIYCKLGVGWLWEHKEHLRGVTASVLWVHRLHLADWYTVWPVSVLEEKKNTRGRLLEMSRSAQWGWNAVLLPWEKHTLHVSLARVKLCALPLSQTVWDRREKQLNHRAVVTWSVHVRRMNDSVWFVSDGRWELEHREQAGDCLTSPTPDWEQW